MKKLLTTLAISTYILAFAPADEDSWITDIQTIVGGHAMDLISRFMEGDVMEGEQVSKGIFRENDPGQDAFHHGSGSVSIVKAEDGFYIQLGEDFDSSPGPDYHVYVSTGIDIVDEASFDKVEQIELGRLTHGKGPSHYRIDSIQGIRSVTIWCKRYREFIMSANLQDTTA